MKWRKSKPETNTGGGCMMVLTRIFLLLFPTMFIGFGIHLFLKNREALSWPTVPIIVTGSEAISSYSEDSETNERKYSVDVTLHFTGQFEGRQFSGSFIRSANVGDTEPSQDAIEDNRLKMLSRYQYDGLTAHVNPSDITQTMVEPSLIGPIFMIVFGLVLLVFIVCKHKEILEE